NGKPHLTLLVNNGYCTRDRFSIRGGQHAMAQVPNMPSGMSCCLRRCHLLANGTYRPADGIIASEKHCRIQVNLQSVCTVRRLNPLCCFIHAHTVAHAHYFRASFSHCWQQLPGSNAEVDARNNARHMLEDFRRVGQHVLAVVITVEIACPRVKEL